MARDQSPRRPRQCHDVHLLLRGCGRLHGRVRARRDPLYELRGRPVARTLPRRPVRVRDQGSGGHSDALLRRNGAPELASARRDPDARPGGYARTALRLHLRARANDEPDAAHPDRGVCERWRLQAAHALSVPLGRGRVQTDRDKPPHTHLHAGEPNPGRHRWRRVRRPRGAGHGQGAQHPDAPRHPVVCRAEPRSRRLPALLLVHRAGLVARLVHGRGALPARPLSSPPPGRPLPRGGSTVAAPPGPADPAVIQPDLGTTIDYDQNGKSDVYLHDVYGSRDNGLVLVTQPDHTFKVKDTGIRRPFPLSVSPQPPTLSSAGGSIHLADLDGDGVPDLIQCQDHSEIATDTPTAAVWEVHLWKPAQGGAPAGFDLTGAPIEPLVGYRCDTELYTLDVNRDGKIDLLVESMLTFGGTEKMASSSYSAISRRQDGSFEVFDTKLPIVPFGGRVLFLDVNGDGLPDAIESGFEDHALRTYLNKGSTFTTLSVISLGLPGRGDQDTFFALAASIDFNGDGQQDLLMPVPGGTLPNQSEVLPAWAILQATGRLGGPTFTLVDPHIPFEAALGTAITLADPHGPRIGDVNGDGAQDVILPLSGVFNVFENLAADQDLLVAVIDGMNAHDPTDPGFVPNVSVSYGHLTDAWITRGADANDPARESDLYLSHADAANDCTYPRTCAVGPRRVVSAYATNNGADSLRHFSVRYRDGRYHRLGRGFLGFAERIVTDLDTGGGTAEFYDTTTFIEGLNVFPFAGQVEHAWHWQPGLPSQPTPDQIELSFTDITHTLVPTNDGATYFTLPTERRVRREQGVYSPQGGPAATIEAYVQQVASSDGATVLRDTVAKVADFDPFGNILAEDLSTSKVDLTLHVERTFKNDTDQWVLAQLQTEKECSAAAMLSACRLLTRTTTIYGEVDTDSIASGDGSADAKLAVSYGRDVFGNVTSVTADDAYGHHRSATTTYDAEGIFPKSQVNAAGHSTLMEYDAGLGVVTKVTDPT